MSRPSMHNLSCAAVGAIAVVAAMQFPTSDAAAEVIHVPSKDLPTIQAGIDLAQDGDTVLVAPGDYVVNLDFLGKSITLRGEEGAGATILRRDIQGGEYAIRIDSGEQGAMVEGFTVDDGFPRIFVANGADVIIRDCEFPESDYSHDLGGAVFIDAASATIIRCGFEGDRVDVGSAIACIGAGAAVSVINCEFIFEDTSPNHLVAVLDGATASITKSTFSSDLNSFPAIDSALFIRDATVSLSDSTFLELDVDSAVEIEGWSAATIEGCTFVGRPEYSSRAILAEGPIALQILNCSFTDFKTNSFNDHGSAILALDGVQLEIHGSSFVNNIAGGDGGAIALLQSVAEIENSHFKGNMTGEAGEGGAIYVMDDSEIVVSNSTFEGNAADWSGGAMHVTWSDLTLENVTFTGNTAELFGGVIRTGFVTIDISNCTMAGNTGGTGGAFSFAAGSFGTVRDTIVTDNEAMSASAGFIAAVESYPTNIELINVRFESNHVSFPKGSIIPKCAFWSTSFTEGVLTNCQFINNTSPTHPAIVAEEGSRLTLNGCAVIGNQSAKDIGAVFFELGDNDRSLIADTVFCDNGSIDIVGPWASGGGNTFCAATSRLVPDSYPTIQSAIDASRHGDVILVGPGRYIEPIDLAGKAVLVRGIDGPHATTIDVSQVGGSAVTMNSHENADARLEGFTIQGGTGTVLDGLARGGGIFCGVLTDPTISNCIIQQNTADRGGGVFLYQLNASRIENCILRHNTAQRGGAIHVQSGSPTIDHTHFHMNTADDRGGAIAAETSASVTISASHFTENEATGRGGAISAVFSDIVVEASRFVQNVAGEEGGAIASATGSHATILSTRFENNGAGSGGAIASIVGSDASASGSIFCGNTPDAVFGPFNDLGNNAFTDGACPDIDPADLNADGIVDGIDLLLLMSAWGECVDSDPCPGDLNADGIVDVHDLLLLLIAWD